MNQRRWMLAVIMGWESVELESSLVRIFSKIPSLNASHEGDLSWFQLRESRCCAWAGRENNAGRHRWKKEAGINCDSLTQLLEVKEMTESVPCLGRRNGLKGASVFCQRHEGGKAKECRVVSWKVSRSEPEGWGHREHALCVQKGKLCLVLLLVV